MDRRRMAMTWMWRAARSSCRRSTLGLFAALMLAVAGCTKPDPSQLPALSTDQLRTSAVIDTDVPGSRQEPYGSSAGGAASPRTSGRLLAFDSESAARRGFEHLATEVRPDVSWETALCDGQDVFLRGAEQIDGYVAGVELRLQGSKQQVTVNVESPRGGVQGTMPTYPPVENLDGGCAPELMKALRQAN